MEKELKKPIKSLYDPEKLKKWIFKKVKISKKSLKNPREIKEKILEILFDSILECHQRLKNKYTPQKEKMKLRYALAYQITVLLSILKDFPEEKDELERFLKQIGFDEDVGK